MKTVISYSIKLCIAITLLLNIAINSMDDTAFYHLKRKTVYTLWCLNTTEKKSVLFDTEKIPDDVRTIIKGEYKFVMCSDIASVIKPILPILNILRNEAKLAFLSLPSNNKNLVFRLFILNNRKTKFSPDELNSIDTIIPKIIIDDLNKKNKDNIQIIYTNKQVSALSYPIINDYKTIINNGLKYSLITSLLFNIIKHSYLDKQDEELKTIGLITVIGGAIGFLIGSCCSYIDHLVKYREKSKLNKSKALAAE